MRSSRQRTVVAVALLGVAVASACSGTSGDALTQAADGGGDDASGGSGGSSGGSGGGSSGASSGASSSSSSGSPVDDAGGPGDSGAPHDSGPALDGSPSDAHPADAAPPPVDGACPYQDALDHDGDGFSFATGDCNDCDPTFNPGAYDFSDGLDQNCDGIPDDEPTGCDANVALASTDPLDAVKSLGLCRQTSESATGSQRTWGVTGAQWVACDGSAPPASASFALGYGNLSKLGVNAPVEGSRMLALSSGTARDPTDPGYMDVSGFDKGFTCNAPPGYPANIPRCPGVTTGQAHDCVALQVTVRVPTNVSSFSFDSNFFTYEFPQYVCSTYNDYYVVLMAPPPAGAMSANIAFDPMNNPISANTWLLRACDPQTAGNLTFACPLGSSSLQGTGFGAGMATGDAGATTTNHAATGWLKTQAPVDTLRGKDVTLRFAVWDSGDGVLDSTTLVDGFRWSQDSATTATVVGP